MKWFGFRLDSLQSGHSVLVQIIIFGNTETVKKLVLELGPPSSFDLTDAAGLNPVIAAVLRGDQTILELLLRKGFGGVSQTLKNALTVANSLSLDQCCKILLAHGVPFSGEMRQIGPFWIKEWFSAAGLGQGEPLDTKKVQSLKLFCRSVIRRSCRQNALNLMGGTRSLGLPPSLRHFVLWGENFLSKPEFWDWKKRFEP